MDKIKSNARWAAILLVMMSTIVILFVIFEQPVASLIDGSFNNVDQPVAVAIIIISFLALDVILPIPSSIISVAASAMLGFVGGAISIWLGLMLGCIFGYWLGARCNSMFLHKILGEKEFHRATTLSNRFGVSILVAMRAVPVLAETSVITAGMVRMPLAKFFLSTALANVGVALAFAYIGSQAMQEDSLLLLIMVSIAALALGWAGVNFFRNRYKARKTRLSNQSSQAKKEYIKENFQAEPIQAKFTVDFSYAVSFTEGVFETHNQSLLDAMTEDASANKAKALVYIDTGVLKKIAELSKKIDQYFECHHEHLELLAPALAVVGGEACKTSDEIEGIYQTMIESGLDRHCFVIVIGGGAVLDAVGFAAASFHRGIKMLRLPSTVLAQNDAGIGVKNGINAYQTKNLIGCFAPPHHIINDFNFLDTLSSRDKRSGIAEAVKVAAIRDRKFFNWLEEHAQQLHDFEAEAMHYMIHRCAALHMKQIAGAGDPFEKGQARPLDYGHWSAHKLESLVNYQLRHGEAVAIGMALDARYAANIGLLSELESLQMISLLEKLGFDLWHPILDKQGVNGEALFIDGLEEFRQHLGGDLCITLLSSIGISKEVNSMDRHQIIKARDWLKERCASYVSVKQKSSPQIIY